MSETLSSNTIEDHCTGCGAHLSEPHSPDCAFAETTDEPRGIDHSVDAATWHAEEVV